MRTTSCWSSPICWPPCGHVAVPDSRSLRRTRHRQDKFYSPPAKLGRSELGPDQLVAIQWSRCLHRRQQQPRAGLRERQQADGFTVRHSLPSCDRRRMAHAHAAHDTDETLFKGARPIALEGISNFVSRRRFQDRAVILPLDPLPSYRTERELDAAFERQRPGIFGALLDLLVHGVRMLPETHLAHPPRMADFAHWAVACGLDTFEAAYRANHSMRSM